MDEELDPFFHVPVERNFTYLDPLVVYYVTFFGLILFMGLMVLYIAVQNAPTPFHYENGMVYTWFYNDA